MDDKAPRELLCDRMQMAETIAGILAFNYLGDGCFDNPAEAPGVGPMVQAVADLLVEAEAAAERANISAPIIVQARAFAQHLAAQSQENLFSHRGFRIGDRWVGMCYWTIEQMARRAHEEHVV